MTIINPASTTNLIAQTQAAPAVTAEERQVDLRPEQIVRATVVDGGLDKAVLEMNHQHYRAQSDIELQTGQSLTLQVLRTHPRLEFRVINDPFDGKLNQLLPLLTRPYDWAQLLETMQQQSWQGQLPESMAKIFSQLQQLLQPLGSSAENLSEEINRLATLLQQLAESAGSGIETLPSARFSNAYAGQARSTAPLSMSVEQLSQLTVRFVQGLQAELSELPGGEPQSFPRQSLATVLKLVQAIEPSVNDLARLPVEQQNELLTVLTQISQRPGFPPRLAVELTRLAEQVAENLQRPVGIQPGGEAAPQAAPQAATQAATPQAATLQAAVPQAAAPQAETPQAATPQVATPQAATPQAATPQAATPQAATPQAATPQAATFQAAAPPNSEHPQPVIIDGTSFPPLGQPSPTSSQPSPLVTLTRPSAEIVDGIEHLLAQARQVQEEKGGLTAELTGRLEGLLDKLRQLPHPESSPRPALPGVEAIAAQLSQIARQDGIVPAGGQLGLLSQLFGFHLETELLNGKKKEALASLKLGLLALRDKLGEQGKEPLHRLEILQMCKAKLHEAQVQFLPLPFNELEEGFLLVEKQRQQNKEDGTESPLQLSLSLRLSALGNMRIDMLYEKSGLQLRVACEDQEKMGYLQDCREELEAAVATVPLRGVSFASDARVPAGQLLERLLPGAAGMLDARI